MHFARVPPLHPFAKKARPIGRERAREARHIEAEGARDAPNPGPDRFPGRFGRFGRFGRAFDDAHGPLIPRVRPEGGSRNRIQPGWVARARVRIVA